MKKSIYFFLSIAITAMLTACSDVEDGFLNNSNPAKSSPDAPIAHKIQYPQKIKLTSIADLTPIFSQLDYNLSNCAANDCSIPRITFNKINNHWKTTSSNLPVQVKKDLFFQLMLPLILTSNEKINAERNIVKKQNINSAAFKAIALKYRIINKDQKALSESVRQALLQRVDIVPPSLALAQSAEESGWGTSRFTIEGNAFFGQWDYSGNGMKPLKQRENLGNYGVARFPSPLASVEGYMLNLNSNKAYQALRTSRAQLRTNNKLISGYKLADNMDKYSERGQAYIERLHKVILQNKLSPLDHAYLNHHKITIIINQ